MSYTSKEEKHAVNLYHQLECLTFEKRRLDSIDTDVYTEFMVRAIGKIIRAFREYVAESSPMFEEEYKAIPASKLKELYENDPVFRTRVDAYWVAGGR